MSEGSKRVADAIKPVLSGALSAQFYAGLLAIPGIGWIFAVPIVSHVTKAALDKAAAWMTQETAVGFSLLWIQVDLAYEVGNAEDAKKKLEDMLNSPQKYSAREQEQIDEYFDETTIDIIQLGIDRLA